MSDTRMMEITFKVDDPENVGHLAHLHAALSGDDLVFDDNLDGLIDAICAVLWRVEVSGLTPGEGDTELKHQKLRNMVWEARRLE